MSWPIPIHAPTWQRKRGIYPKLQLFLAPHCWCLPKKGGDKIAFVSPLIILLWCWDVDLEILFYGQTHYPFVITFSCLVTVSCFQLRPFQGKWSIQLQNAIRSNPNHASSLPFTLLNLSHEVRCSPCLVVGLNMSPIIHTLLEHHEKWP